MNTIKKEWIMPAWTINANDGKASEAEYNPYKKPPKNHIIITVFADTERKALNQARKLVKRKNYKCVSADVINNVREIVDVLRDIHKTIKKETGTFMLKEGKRK